MGGSKSMIVGYKYLFDIHMGLCRGAVDELTTIKIGDLTAWEGSISSNQTLYIDKYNLFGGEEREGGVQGNLHLLFGQDEQQVHPQLKKALSPNSPISAFKGVFTAFFSGIICAMNPYPKKWTFRVNRTTQGWERSAMNMQHAKIELTNLAALDKQIGQRNIRAMNPAHILFECRTNKSWGRGMDASLIDITSYEKAAEQLAKEKFGLCFKWSKAQSLDEFEQIVLDHIAAAQFLSRSTGLWTLYLIRGGYNSNELLLFDEHSGLLGIDEDSTASTEGAINQIIVTYHDPVRNEKGMVRERNLGAIYATGGAVSSIKNYPGIPTAELAARVAARDLAVATTASRKFTLRLDRRGYMLEPGAVFKIRSLKRGIKQLVLRIAKIDYGTVTKGEIKVTAVVDIFGLPAMGTTVVQPIEWRPPDIVAKKIITYQLFEVPYRDFVANQMQVPSALSGLVAAVARRPDNGGLMLNYNIYSGTKHNELTKQGAAPFCSNAKIVGDIAVGVEPITITLTDIDEQLGDIVTGSAALINDEIFRIVNFISASREITLARGCADTVAAYHASGSIIWFYQNSVAIDTTEYLVNELVYIKLIGRTNSNVFNLTDALSDSVKLTQRQARPYPPAKVQINQQSYPKQAKGILNITWAQRNRITQADQLIDATQDNIAPEIGQSSSLQLVKVQNNTVLINQQNITNNAIELVYNYTGAVKLILWSVRDGLDSHQRYSWQFDYTPPVMQITAPDTLKQLQVSDAVKVQLTVNFGENPTWKISQGTLPVGLKFNAATATIEGTATTVGSYNYTIAVQDKNAFKTEVAIVTEVNAPPPPTAAPTP